jgi:hypothetical protein
MTYEIIWESGEHSLANYDSDEEMTQAVLAQHTRATEGEAGGPAEGTLANRVVKVFKYDSDPAEATDGYTTDLAKAMLGEQIDAVADENGVVGVSELHAALANALSSTVQSAPHESNYKAESVEEFSLADLEGAEA